MKLLILMVLISSLAGCATETPSRSLPGEPVMERRLSDFNGTMAFASEEVYANTADDENVLAEFSTKFNKNSTNRAENIALAATAIDKKIVFPGELFSFNETVGPTNSKTGYKRSKIFIRGQESMGVGGGVCQVSSTLYNAVKNAGLNVTERHPHSRRVRYVQKNNDAAVSYGGIDFKFVNDMDYPIMICSDVENDTITVSIKTI